MLCKLQGRRASHPYRHALQGLQIREMDVRCATVSVRGAGEGLHIRHASYSLDNQCGIQKTRKTNLEKGDVNLTKLLMNGGEDGSNN